MYCEMSFGNATSKLSKLESVVQTFLASSSEGCKEALNEGRAGKLSCGNMFEKLAGGMETFLRLYASMASRETPCHTVYE